MHSIGPYSFTETDARRTVGNLDEVWALYAQGRDAGVLRPLYPTLTGDLATDLSLVWAAWSAAGPALREAGQLPARAEGAVAQLNVSGGGLPKTPVERVQVGWRGVEGDRQATRVHHGRPWQALCLWSTEAIDTLRAAGHPIAPGLAGENITVGGLPWADVRAGVRLQVGEVLCEISAFALPCASNMRWFTGGDFMAMHHDRGPVSRVYATVLQPGSIATGDLVVLEP
ncbi:MAG: MOSC domain-containing protein [Actinomycetota bacterium]|nr:MOSC domain-containing protein [Actinomycetota bacterium]